MTLHLGSAALWYAERGCPVLPLMVGGKHPPLLRGWQHNASTDPNTIRRWWTATPDANIGVLTGARFDAVDIDGIDGHRTRVRYWCVVPGCTDIGADGTCPHELGPFGAIDRDAIAKVLTPRPGGMHIWVPPTGEHNFTGGRRGLDHVDYRGINGYVVAPPSTISPAWAAAHPPAVAGRYEFLGTPHLGEQE